MTILIKKEYNEEMIKTAIKHFEKKTKRPTLITFYGKMKGTFGDGLTYRKNVR